MSKSLDLTEFMKPKINRKKRDKKYKNLKIITKNNN